MFLLSAYRFLTPWKPIQSRDNIYYQYYHSEAEGNQRDIEHVVKMFRLLTNIDKYFIIVDHCPALDKLSLTIYPF